MSEPAHPPSAAGDGHSVAAGLARPGSVTYLHIPAADARRAAEFYREVFGWSVRDADGARPSFDDAGGTLGGAWMADRHGLLPYVYVADVAQTVARIVAHGGAMVTDPYPEGRLTVATFRDPAGNVMGLWHDTTRSPAAAGTTPAAAGTTADVEPVPEHLRTVTPRLVVRDARAAIDFYVRAFDAREIGERHSTPDGMLVHAELRVGDAVVMVTEGDGYRALLCTYWPDVDTAWARAVAAGAEVLHPLADRFYGERGGRLRDPFDQEWMLGARRERLSAEQIATRARSRR